MDIAGFLFGREKTLPIITESQQTINDFCRASMELAIAQQEFDMAEPDFVVAATAKLIAAHEYHDACYRRIKAIPQEEERV